MELYKYHKRKMKKYNEYFAKRTILFIFFMFFYINTFAQERIAMKLEASGIYTIPCEVNGLQLRFIFDTGAADVSLSLVEALFMLKNGYISEDDFVGSADYKLADGSISENAVINLKTIKIGNVTLENVQACISSELKSSLLLGQSAIRKMGPYSINGDYLILDNHSTKSLNGMKKLTDASGNVYTGNVMNGVYDGQGKMEYSNGEKYEGEWKNGKRNGFGKLFNGGGRIIYEGQWKEDKRNGQGKSYGLIGNTSIGVFYDDEFYKGTTYFEGGDSLTFFYTGKGKHSGTRYYKNGESMTGEWTSGYKNGKFVHTYPDPDKTTITEYYIKDSLVSVDNLDATSRLVKYEHFTGKGEKEYADGVYTGMFVGGNRQGKGNMIFSNGAVYNGEWYYNRMSGHGTIIWSDGSEYEGSFKNGDRCGYGTYIWSNGDKYTGYWEKNNQEGTGTYFYANGNIRTGLWKNGECNSPIVTSLPNNTSNQSDSEQYYTAYTTRQSFLREGPGGNYDIITKIPVNDFVFIEGKERYKEFSKVLYIKTGDEGYINSKYLDGFTTVKVNEKGLLEVTGKIYSKYAEVILHNDAEVTAKIKLGSNSYEVRPHSSKTISNLNEGKYNIRVSSPGTTPYVGIEDLKSGYKYERRFYLRTIKQ